LVDDRLSQRGGAATKIVRVLAIENGESVDEEEDD
jgi:hypothetical protein